MSRDTQGADIVGPYCGVGLDRLLDKPMLAHETLVDLSAADIGEGANQATLVEADGEPAVGVGSGFEFATEVDFPAGLIEVQVTGSAPSEAADGYIVQIGDHQTALNIPCGEMGVTRVTTRIPHAGRCAFKIFPSEKPGATLKRVSVFAVEVTVPRPPMRDELRRKHPRMFFSPDAVATLRERSRHPRVQKFYHPPGLLTQKPPEHTGFRDPTPYQWLPSYALGYLVQPEEEQLAAVIEWLQMATTYGNVGVDLHVEFFMEGVALCYDWLYEYLPEKLRVQLRSTIGETSRRLFEASVLGQTGGGEDFQQNHYWWAHLSLALGAAAIYDEVPETDQWLSWAWDRFERIAMTFGPDGGYHEGPAYWDYAMPTLYKYLDLYEWCTGLRAPAVDEGLRGQSEFRSHHLYPGLQTSAPLGDANERHYWNRLHLQLVRNHLWEAKRFQDPLTMGLAQLWLEKEGPSWGYYYLLWLDENLPAHDPLEKLPPARYYSDIETAFMRTSWLEDATYATFSSRPMGGHKWAQICAEYGLEGVGHNHPDQNHFLLFGRGEALAVDPGYTYEKKTRNHNTVLVDGRGQYRDGQMWPTPNPGRAHITGFVNEGDVTIVSGDATSAYPDDLGLMRFERTFVLAGRDLAVVHDRLMASEPRVFSWLLHHRGEIAEIAGIWTITRGGAQLTVRPLLPNEIEAETVTYRPQYLHYTRDHTPYEPDVNMLELKTHRTEETTFVVPLLIGDAGTEVPEIERLDGEGFEGIRVGGIVVAFNDSNAEITIPTPDGGTINTRSRTTVVRLDGLVQQIVQLDNP